LVLMRKIDQDIYDLSDDLCGDFYDEYKKDYRSNPQEIISLKIKYLDCFEKTLHRYKKEKKELIKMERII